MSQFAYSPDTGELINTTTPAAWMGATPLAPPTFDPKIAGCFFQNGAWVIVTADQLTPARAAQITTLTTAYDAAIQLPVAYMGTTFQADDDSQSVLAKSLSAGSVMAGFYWVDAANAKVSMTFAQAQGLAMAMFVQGQAAFDNLFTKKKAVRDATTIAAVQAVVW